MLIRLSALALLAFTHAATAQGLSEDEVKALALEAILENPEIIMEAVEILREREAEAQYEAGQAALVQNRDRLENDPNAPVLGNLEGDITIVEFFDYNCPYCKRAKEEVDAALAADGNIRVVYREWPVLGEASVEVARAALAARSQGLYEPFHNALMAANGRLNGARAMQIAETVGLDIAQLQADMGSDAIDAHIATSLELAQMLGFTGTPSFVIGGAMAPGLIAHDDMLAMVEEARTSN